jgi:uncharacterized protein
MKRRDFITNSAIAATGLFFADKITAFPLTDFVSKRPALKDRKFVSSAVEAKIAEVKSSIKDKELAWMFENCYPNTLDTTVEIGTRDNKPDSFVITGDIHALWLRDSTAQVTPYLSLVKDDEDLQNLIKGLIHRQAYSILLEPYANAFLKDLSEKGWDDLPNPACWRKNGKLIHCVTRFGCRISIGRKPATRRLLMPNGKARCV